VGVDVPHLVAVAVCDADDHVLNKAHECANSCEELSVAEPAACDEFCSFFTLNDFEIELEVGKILCELTTAALDCDNA
jgi:hypothetical protein